MQQECITNEKKKQKQGFPKHLSSNFDPISIKLPLTSIAEGAADSISIFLSPTQARAMRSLAFVCRTHPARPICIHMWQLVNL